MADSDQLKVGVDAQRVPTHLVDRDGRFGFLMSETLTAEQLTTIVGLLPAPSTTSF